MSIMARKQQTNIWVQEIWQPTTTTYIKSVINLKAQLR